jgi:THO complex subunit 3
MESREEERKGSGGAAAGGGSTPGANLRDLVSREYYGHKKKVIPLNASPISHYNFF